MKKILTMLLLLAGLVPCSFALNPLDGLDNVEWNRVHQDRNVLLPYLMDKLRVLSQNELVEQVNNTKMRQDVRIASALVLLADYESTEAHMSALKAFSLRSGSGLGEWEGGMDPRKEYPVAMAAGYRPELMPVIVKGSIDGTYSMDAMEFVILDQYRRNGPDPRTLLLKLREEASTDAEHHRCNDLLDYMGSDAYPKLAEEQIRATPARGTDAWAVPKKMAQIARPAAAPVTDESANQSAKAPAPSQPAPSDVPSPAHVEPLIPISASTNPTPSAATESQSMKWLWYAIPGGLAALACLLWRSGRKGRG